MNLNIRYAWEMTIGEGTGGNYLDTFVGGGEKNVKGKRGKYSEKEKISSRRRRTMEKEMEENIWRRFTFICGGKEN